MTDTCCVAKHQEWASVDFYVSQGLYTRALSVRSAVPHPKIMGIIRECGGKMHMSEGKCTQGIDYLHGFASKLMDAIQRIGRAHRATSSNHSETTTRLARYSVFRY